MPLTSFWYFTLYSSVSFVDFQQANVSWERYKFQSILGKLKIEHMQRKSNHLVTLFSLQSFPLFCSIFWFNQMQFFLVPVFPANIYLLKVNKVISRNRCEICSNLKVKTPEQCK